jgi:hypothetical protein
VVGLKNRVQVLSVKGMTEIGPGNGEGYQGNDPSGAYAKKQALKGIHFGEEGLAFKG